MNKNSLADLEKELGLTEITPEQEREINKEPEQKEGKKSSKDPRFWKPTIKNEKRLYEARIRMLPQKGWLQDKTLPWAIGQYMHYIKEPDHNLFLYTKCRKTLGLNEDCPICKHNWAIYNAAKKRGDKAEMDKMTSRQNRLSFIGNILVLEDLTTPTFNKEVKLWEHTKKMNGRLMSPLKEETKEEAAQPSLRKAKKKELFVPYHPTQGRNFDVIVTPDAESGLANYDQSDWDEDGLSPIGTTSEEVLSLLERTYPLDEFIKDVPSAEELVQKYQEFNEKLLAMQVNVPSGSTSISMHVPESKSNVTAGDSGKYFAPDTSTEGKGVQDAVATETPAVGDSAMPPAPEDDLPF